MKNRSNASPPTLSIPQLVPGESVVSALFADRVRDSSMLCEQRTEELLLIRSAERECRQPSSCRLGVLRWSPVGGLEKETLPW